jgi:hypothetical protein
LGTFTVTGPTPVWTSRSGKWPFHHSGPTIKQPHTPELLHEIGQLRLYRLRNQLPRPRSHKLGERTRSFP